MNFSNLTEYRISGGTDTMVHQFDIARLESLPANEQLPKNTFRENVGALYYLLAPPS